MASQADLVIALRAVDSASATLRNVANETQRMGQNAHAAAPGFSTLAAAVGVGTVAAQAFIGGVGAIAGALGSAFKSTSDFGQAMANIKATIPRADFEQFGGGLQTLALQLGKDYPLSAGQAASAMEILAQKGISAENIMHGGAEAVVQLSSATGADLATAANIAAVAMDTFNVDGDNMSRITDLMTGAMLRGGVKATDFGFALQAGGAAVRLAGGTIEDASIAIAAMAKAGIEGSDAGTSLKTMYMNLIPSSKAAKDVAKELGIVTKDGSNQFFDAAGNVKSYEEISRILATSTAGLTSQQKLQALETLFGSDAIRAAAVAARLGAGEFGNLGEQVREQGLAAQASADKMDSVHGSMQQLSGSVETLGILLLGQLGPAFRGVIDFATAFTNELIDLAGGLDLSGVIGAVQSGMSIVSDAFFAAGNALSEFLGGLLSTDNPVSNFARLLGEVFASALVGVAALLRGDAKGAIAAFGNALGILGEAFGPIIGMLIDLGIKTVEAARAVLDVLGPALLALGGWLRNNQGLILGVVAAIGTFVILTTVVGWISGAIAAFGAFSAAVGAAGGILGAIVAILGGPVTLIIAAIAIAVGLLALAWSENWGDIQGKTQAVVDWAGTVPGMLAQVWDDITTGLSDLVNSASTAWQDFVTAYSDQASALSDAVNTTWSDIGTAISDAITAVQDSVTTGWDGITGAVQSALDAIQSAIDTASGAINTAISDLWNTLVLPETQAALADLGTAIQEGWAAIGDLISTALTTIQGVIQTAWDTISASVDTAWTTIQGLIQTAWDTISTAISTALTSIQGLIQTTWDTISAAISTALDTIQSAVQTTWDTISTTVSTVLTTIQDAVTTTWDTIVTTISTAGQQAQDAVGSSFDAMGGIVSGALDAVVGIISGFAGSAYSAAISLGQAAIDGIRDGINAGVAAVAGAAANMIRSAIGAARAEAAAESPSKRMFELGQDMATGLEQGIQESEVVAATDAVAGAIGRVGTAVDVIGPAIEDWRKGVVQLTETGVKPAKAAIDDWWNDTKGLTETGITPATAATVELTETALVPAQAALNSTTKATRSLSTTTKSELNVTLATLHGDLLKIIGLLDGTTTSLGKSATAAAALTTQTTTLTGSVGLARGAVDDWWNDTKKLTDTGIKPAAAAIDDWWKETNTLTGAIGSATSATDGLNKGAQSLVSSGIGPTKAAIDDWWRTTNNLVNTAIVPAEGATDTWREKLGNLTTTGLGPTGTATGGWGDQIQDLITTGIGPASSATDEWTSRAQTLVSSGVGPATMAVDSLKRSLDQIDQPKALVFTADVPRAVTVPTLNVSSGAVDRLSAATATLDGVGSLDVGGGVDVSGGIDVSSGVDVGGGIDVDGALRASDATLRDVSMRDVNAPRADFSRAEFNRSDIDASRVDDMRVDSAQINVSARQSGGPVSAAHPYLVGEAGTELFVPSTNGEILPHQAIGSRLAGGIVYNVTVNVAGSVHAAQDLAREVRDELIKIGRGNGSTLGAYA